MMRRAHRMDGNQSELVRSLIECNFTVRDTSMVGDGFPDFVCARNGRNLLVEVKDGNGQLLPGQKQFALEWKGAVIVAHSVIDVLNNFGQAFQRTKG
jgi:hypothetical protein